MDSFRQFLDVVSEDHTGVTIMAGGIARLGDKRKADEPRIETYGKIEKPFKRIKLMPKNEVQQSLAPSVDVSSSSEDELEYDPDLGTEDAGKSVRRGGSDVTKSVSSTKSMNTGSDRPKVLIRNQYGFYVPFWVYENRYHNRYKSRSEGNYAGIRQNADNHFNPDPKTLEKLSLTQDGKSYQRMGSRGLTVPAVLVEIKHESLKFRQLVDATKEKGIHLTGETGLSEIFVIEPYGRYSNLEKRLLEPGWQLPKEAQPILSKHKELMQRIETWQKISRGVSLRSDRSDRDSGGRG